MNINYSEIITHIVGFMIVLWLLRKYAWGSILGFIQKRRDTIAESFAEIEAGRQDVETQKQKYDAEIQKIEDTRREKIQEAVHEGQKISDQIKDEARQDAVAAREKAAKDVELEMEKAAAGLQQSMVNAVFTATEKLLGEELDRAKHEKLITDFLANVKVK